MIMQYLQEDDYEAKKASEIAVLEQTIALQKKVIIMSIFM